MKTYYTVKSSHYNSSKYIFDSLSQAENKVSQLKKEYPNEPVEVVQLVLLSDHDRIVAELKAEVEYLKRESADNASGFCDSSMFKQMSRKIEALTQQLQEAEKIMTELRKHSRHGFSCDVMTPKGECSCGYNRAVDYFDSYLAKKKGQV